ncbi:MAG: PqqD family protein [Candidatus Riflebacteria bacterium]|nr:PqqD family protein [Candidatus Riflebacteria bacterium]
METELKVSDVITRRIGDLISDQLDGDTVMMSMERGKYFGLDKVGTRIWELLAKPRKISELIEILLDEFEGTRETITNDLFRFLAHLEKEKMLKVERFQNSNCNKTFKSG